MIPLLWFLLGWLVLVALFALAALITVGLMLKFGVSSINTYLSTALFLGVTFIILGATGLFLSNVDWTQSMSIFSSPTNTLLPF